MSVSLQPHGLQHARHTHTHTHPRTQPRCGAVPSQAKAQHGGAGSRRARAPRGRLSRGRLCGSPATCGRAMQETQVQSLGWENPPEKGMATHSSILLAWRILWTEEPDGLQSMRFEELDTTEQLTLTYLVNKIRC